MFSNALRYLATAASFVLPAEQFSGEKLSANLETALGFYSDKDGSSGSRVRARKLTSKVTREASGIEDEYRDRRVLNRA